VGVRVEELGTALASFGVMIKVLAGAFARLGNIGSSSASFDVLLPAMLSEIVRLVLSQFDAGQVSQTMWKHLQYEVAR